VQKNQSVIHGLAVDPAGRAPAAHTARAFEQSDGLAGVYQNFCAGKSSYSCPDDKHL
jgi:hypothetical protein